MVAQGIEFSGMSKDVFYASDDSEIEVMGDAQFRADDTEDGLAVHRWSLPLVQYMF